MALLKEVVKVYECGQDSLMLGECFGARALVLII